MHPKKEAQIIRSPLSNKKTYHGSSAVAEAKMKTVFSLFAISALTLTFVVGCGSDSSSDYNENENENTSQLCGDGIIATTEECDDENSRNGDGCSGDCMVEPGWECSGEPSVCNTKCGDGMIYGEEECDDSNNISGDGCSEDCKSKMATLVPANHLFVIQTIAATEK
jgi:cysteine-rich repeat protein